MNAEQWNTRYPIGTPVLAYPGLRPDDSFVVAARERRTVTGRPNPDATDLSPRLVTRTRSEAQVLGGHTDVVWVDGHSACIALDHIDPLPTWGGGEEAAAARNVPRNPNPLCRDFQPKPEPAEYWCANCRWNKPMHDNETARAAIAEALKCLPETEVTR